jgi:hypothetical protein
MTSPFAPHTSIHPAAVPALAGLGASCARGAGDREWESGLPGGPGMSGVTRDGQGHISSAGGLGAGAR